MLPLVLARQIEQGLKDYLLTSFPPHKYFTGFMDNLLKEGSFYKGPYISVRLPFRKGLNKNRHFPSFALPFHPHLHQEKAFARLGAPEALSSIIATGMGSGKTECYMFPLLDYTYSVRGRPGIKAVIIYPMNALAHDQARRFAERIYKTESLKGNVTAGLFIGRDKGTRMPELRVMGKHMVITHRQTMLQICLYSIYTPIHLLKRKKKKLK